MNNDQIKIVYPNGFRIFNSYQAACVYLKKLFGMRKEARLYVGDYISGRVYKDGKRWNYFYENLKEN